MYKGKFCFYGHNTIVSIKFVCMIICNRILFLYIIYMHKSLWILLLIIYFFTAQLSVHAFTMHPWTHWTGEHHDEEKKPDCWHPTPTHDHNSHDEGNNDDHNGHDMTMCMEQSVWVYNSDVIDYIDCDHVTLLPSQEYATTKKDHIDQYFYSIKDPWRWEDPGFSKFLKSDLYGHGIIMHC